MTPPAKPPDRPLPDPRLMRRSPARAAMEELARVLHPEGPAQIQGVRRLRGGISAAMHAFDLHAPDHERRRLVLRRCFPAGHGDERVIAARMWGTLELLEGLSLPAPRPVWFDGAGGLFGVPAVVMTRVPGHPVLAPRDPEGWVDQTAQAIAAVHRTPLAGHDLNFLQDTYNGGHDSFWPLVERARHIATDPDSAAVLAVLARDRARMEAQERTLTHGDYWPGNVLFSRGRLTAIVDWDWASLDCPAVDVACCRVDLSMLFGPEAADRFVHTYEEAIGSPVRLLPAWDLLAAARFMSDPASSVAGYADLGLRDLSLDVIRERFRAFIRRALARAGA